ncbi:MAG: hypothetical protein FJ290_18410 [Planctomycetes bacterium]|nr:hypothetical protein [Planctomycetota bacterium]
MERYDPLVAPDPVEWQRIDEGERIFLVKEYHRRAKIRLPNENLHAVIHTIVENQIAMGDETPAKETLARLMSEGLDRHDAVHAIGSVLSVHMVNLLKTKRLEGANEEYFGKLRALTAEAWLKSWEKPAGKPHRRPRSGPRSPRPGEAGGA